MDMEVDLGPKVGGEDGRMTGSKQRWRMILPKGSKDDKNLKLRKKPIAKERKGAKSSKWKRKLLGSKGTDSSQPLILGFMKKERELGGFNWNQVGDSHGNYRNLINTNQSKSSFVCSKLTLTIECCDQEISNKFRN